MTSYRELGIKNVTNATGTELITHDEAKAFS